MLRNYAGLEALPKVDTLIRRLRIHETPLTEQRQCQSFFVRRFGVETKRLNIRLRSFSDDLPPRFQGISSTTRANSLP